MAGNSREDPLAYGDYHDGDQDSDRGIVGDTFQRLRDRYLPQQPASGYSNQGQNQQNYVPLDSNQTAQQQSQSPPPNPTQHSSSLVSSLVNTLQGAAQDLGSEFRQRISGNGEVHSHTHAGAQCAHGVHDNAQHRYGSFAAQRVGNDAKWFVDGCGYFWAVSKALEQARESIWILDWWLSPELYLRRPPSKNEQYRLDHMLQAAAERGVKVNVIVYKEVAQALTRKYLSPTIPKYLHSLLPGQIDRMTSVMCGLGLAATFASLEHVEAQNPLIVPPLTVSSSHTKQVLESLHPNIAVFRHPDHLPAAQTLESSFISSLKHMSLNAASASNLSEDALKAIYGVNSDIILYWAHHEKLCLIDGTIAFMGGLDLCYGRWDTNQHPIADAHPSNLDDIVFPGQDYNNARIMDFHDVSNWQKNKLDRKESSRMGWSDLSFSLRGPVVEDLRAHFVERWNFIFNEKYDIGVARYSRLTFRENTAGAIPLTGQQLQPNQGSPPNASGQAPYFPPPPTSDGGAGGEYNQASGMGGAAAVIRGRVINGMHHVQDQYLSGNEHHSRLHGEFQDAGISCQIARSCTKWSHGVPTEHSIANAYISVIQNSKKFVYIENQFFITATSDQQKPVRNKIGAAIVERIIRAAKAGEKYKVIVVMPAVPGFAGDLKDDSSLGTRAIMEYQYKSINRGGYSIMEMISKAGYDPTEYIRFYNLRNYDRINSSAAMAEVEQKSGVNYEDARREHDDIVDPSGYRTSGGGGYKNESSSGQNYSRYQQAAAGISERQGLGRGRWDTVSECYMLGGADIREVPWQDGDLTEMDAFVSEELYIHTKLLIADDQVVICGSANLNDRSQLGDHDSEIVVIVEDPSTVDSYMNGQAWKAAKFAATLRRQIFRKHLGLLSPQNMEQPNQNFEMVGVPNIYDYGSAEDKAVMDPLSDSFLNLWNGRARQNTEAFGQIFHPVPHDSVRNWKDYGTFYEKFFHEADEEADGKSGTKKPAKYQWGHVVSENFSAGSQGVKEMKDVLHGIKGTLVEMPLLFLIDEHILAKEGLSLNSFTEEVYT